MRGRTVPPPFVPITGTNPSVEEMLRAQTKPGVYMLSYEHDDHCPTITSQRWEDCICKVVDHRLLRYVGEGGAR